MKLIEYVKALLLFLIFIIIAENTIAQNSVNEQKRQFYSALNFMYDKKYDKALNLLQHLDSVPLAHFLDSKEHKLKNDSVSLEKVYVKYLIGACYLQMQYEMENTLPYVEYVINSGYSQMPEVVLKDLGQIYHKDYQFNKAIYYFNGFLKKLNPTNPDYSYAKRMIQICKNGIEITKDTLEQDIFNMGRLLNTEDSESNPRVVAANDVMIFTFRQFMEDPRIHKGTPIMIQQIKISYKKLGVWTKPQSIIFDTPKNLKNAKLSVIGLSFGGAELFVKIKKTKRIEYYSTFIERNKCRNFNKIHFINSKYDVSHVNVSADGNVVLFSGKIIESERNDEDIFIVKKTKKGKWSIPKRLNNTINTSFDEINPVMSNKGDVLYFSSKGHNTMGGFDVFKTEKQKNGLWTKPQNMGFPINTTEDNDDFYVSNRGNTGYFSATQFDKYNNRNLYSVNLRKNIPVTLINGKLLVGDSLRPINAKIQIINHEMNSKYLLNTNPDSINGNYYLFCPPDNDYEILVEAEGYMPQMVNIHIPQQAYFYTLFQEIQLKPIKALDTRLGEEITIKNAFYDIKREHIEPIDVKIDNKNYDELVYMMDNIKPKYKADSATMKNTEGEKDYSSLFSFVENAIESEDSVSLELLRTKIAEQDLYSQTYFFCNDTVHCAKNKVQIGDRTVNTAKPVDARNMKKRKQKSTLELKNFIQANRIVSIFPDSLSANLNKKQALKIEESSKTKKNWLELETTRTIFKYDVFFESNSSVIDEKYYKQLNELVDLLLDNPALRMQVSGYSNSVGTVEKNLRLSKERALSVMKYFILKNIRTEKIQIQFFGETKSKNETTIENLNKNRRAKIIIMEIAPTGTD